MLLHFLSINIYMYVCMCICIYICVCIHMYICTYTYIYTYICIYMCVCIDVCMYVCITYVYIFLSQFAHESMMEKLLHLHLKENEKKERKFTNWSKKSIEIRKHQRSKEIEGKVKNKKFHNFCLTRKQQWTPRLEDNFFFKKD